MDEFYIEIELVLDLVFNLFIMEKRNQKFIIHILNSILNRKRNECIKTIEYLKAGMTSIQVNKEYASQNKRKRENNEKENIDDICKFNDIDILLFNISIYKNLIFIILMIIYYN